MIDDRRKLCLIGLRKVTTVERCVFDLACVFALRDFGLLNNNIGVEFVPPHQVVVTDETRRVFVHHHQAAILVGLTRLAATIQLRMRFKDTENLVTVRDLLPQLRAAPGGGFQPVELACSSAQSSQANAFEFSLKQLV